MGVEQGTNDVIVDVMVVEPGMVFVIVDWMFLVMVVVVGGNVVGGGLADPPPVPVGLGGWIPLPVE